MEYSILKKEKTWANIKVQNRASQTDPPKPSHSVKTKRQKKYAAIPALNKSIPRKESLYEDRFQKALALNP